MVRHKKRLRTPVLTTFDVTSSCQKILIIFCKREKIFANLVSPNNGSNFKLFKEIFLPRLNAQNRVAKKGFRTSCKHSRLSLGWNPKRVLRTTRPARYVYLTCTNLISIHLTLIFRSIFLILTNFALYQIYLTFFHFELNCLVFDLLELYHIFML